jgi:hypothetical protein
MIAPRYGQPCECEACTIAGVRGKRLIETSRGQWAHGRELARLYQAVAEFERNLKALPRRTMRPAIVQTDPHGRPLED